MFAATPVSRGVTRDRPFFVATCRVSHALAAAALALLLSACGGGGGANFSNGDSAGSSGSTSGNGSANASAQSAGNSCAPSVSSGFAAVTASNGLSYTDGTADASASGGEGVGIGASLGTLSGATVTVTRADGMVIGSASTDTYGMVTVRNCGDTQPLLVRASGSATATYWDEALQQSVAFPADRSMHLMLVPTGGGQTLSRNAGITPLTEAAYQYAVAQLGGAEAWKAPANVVAAHQAVTAAFNAYLPAPLQVSDPTRLAASARDASSPVFDGSSASSSGNLRLKSATTKALNVSTSPNVRYGLVMAGLARGSSTYNPASTAPALDLLRQFALDLSDGTLDGLAPGNLSVAPHPGARAFAAASLQGDLLVGIQDMIATNSRTQSLASYALGGSVVGLTGSGLELANGPGTISIASGATGFDFGSVLVEGSAYSVSVRTQPSQQSCTVSLASGTAGAANVASPVVTCQNLGAPRSLSGSISGLTAGGLVLITGSQTVSPANAATTFTFGASFSTGDSYNVSVQTQPVGLVCTVSNGSGTVPAGDVGNVQVSCSPSGNRFTWVRGANTVDDGGVYGVLGQADNSNAPGARYLAAQARDPSGNFWLFGGFGRDGGQSSGALNDLWMYSPNDNVWTWVSGSNISGDLPVYGTQGVEAPGNRPGARHSALAWSDAAGDFWLFGGYGYIANGSTGYLGDLWRFRVGTGQWTWMAGSSSTGEAAVHGTQGVSSGSNVPGARNLAGGWWQSSDDSLWLFGGCVASGFLNDVWRYKNGQWTWMQGSNALNAPGLYGTRGTPAPTNMPGARCDTRMSTDPVGNVWLFGGLGESSSGGGGLNDLWRRSAGTGEWTWVSGADAPDPAGSFGTRGVAHPANAPEGRDGNPAFWSDSSGNLWVYGGRRPNSSLRFGDLWRYSVIDDQWTWMHGSSATDAAAVFGTLGQADDNAFPGNRRASASWTDAAGRLWLFGGTSSAGLFSDLWRYQP